jgi:hypothetical protein
MATDDLRKIRQSNAEAQRRIGRVRERLASSPEPESEDEDRPTLEEIVEAVGRARQESTGELVIDAAAKRATLRAPPWVIAIGVATVALVAWLVGR